MSEPDVDRDDHLSDEEFEALVELKARAAFQEMDIIAEGEAMLAARWDQPFGSPRDHYELANAEVLTNPSTGEKVEQTSTIREVLPGEPVLRSEDREETLTPGEQAAEDAHRAEIRDALPDEDD